MSNNQQKPQPESQDNMVQVAAYQEVVAAYEALDRQIDALIMTYGGASKNMPEDVLTQYREMARRRGELRNEMRILEAALFEEDEP